MKYENEKQFHKELLELFEKHQLAVVPSHEFSPNAHDPMLIVELDDGWRKFFNKRLYSHKETEDERNG